MYILKFRNNSTQINILSNGQTQACNKQKIFVKKFLLFFISAENFPLRTHGKVPTLLNWVSTLREKTIIFSLRIHSVM